MKPSTNTWDTLAGAYQLRPGQHPGVIGQRPVLGAGRLARLLAGQRGEQVGHTLTSVFTLCAHAHRRTAALALAAAQPDPAHAPVASPSVMLYVETARDHLRSIALDWPQRQPGTTADKQAMAWLRGCPLPLATARTPGDAATAWQTLARLRTWLEERILHQPLPRWLSEHQQPDALADWCRVQAAQLAPARSLANWFAPASALTPETRLLELLDLDPTRQTVQLRQLAQALVDEPDFVQQPSWLGQCAENGPWARLRHRPMQASIRHSAWTRLAARWTDLLEIAAASPDTDQPGAIPLLSSGALALASGQALAWCEMARGLLLHWVQLDGDGAVQDYRVLAPTEWNFHPDGALARAVAALTP
ncbi:nickel-dependent hydrogenase large subunit, partial [Rhodoferax sp.]|uniref:nickel-dependent hydrogenase large subunit n=1 Tax=Rhodoferax sp. TaxID=50421 RepID=UPI0027485575|nr:nickel-dependent hydrogenase large subunit [Rhodoferax sp.]